MPVNSAVTAALVPQAVPPDRECVASLTEIVQGVASFTQVLLTNTAQQGGTGDSTADLALNIANTALALAQSVQASIPQRRSSGDTPITIPTGESISPFSWTPDMPDTNYLVSITLYGPGTGTLPAGNWSWYVVDASRALNSCQIRFTNIPAGFSYVAVVTDLSV